MPRIAKLLDAIQSSQIPERQELVGAINKCLADPPHAAQAAEMETLLAFGERRSSVLARTARNAETQFRLHARIAICLIGYVAFPARIHVARQLKNDADDARYGDVAWAQEQFRRYKSIAAAVQRIAPVAIVDLEKFARETQRAGGVVSARVNAAVRVGNDAIKAVIRDLKSGDVVAEGYAQRWFGNSPRPTLLARLEAMLAHATKATQPLLMEYEVEDVWGKSAPNSTTITLGRKFFSDDHTRPSSRLGRDYISNEEQVATVREVTRENALLKRRVGSLLVLDGRLTPAAPTDSVADIMREYAEEHVAEGQGAGRSAAQIADELLADVAALGIPPTDDRAAARSKMNAADARAAAQRSALQARQGDLARMEITAFGCYVHELSHAAIGTDDVDAAVVGVVGGQKAYGPLLCLMLASEQPQHALRNADNYRHFVESWVE